MSKNPQKSYNLALSKLTSFRSLYKLKQKWPVPVDDLLNSIAFLSVQGLSGGPYLLIYPAFHTTTK